MSEHRSNNQPDDRLSRLIDSLINRNLSDPEISEGLDQEHKELLATARQVIALSQNYPGPPELSPQDKIRFLTLFKAQAQKAQGPARSKLSSFVQQHRISLAIPASLILVLLFYIFRKYGEFLITLPASAGIQSSTLPIIILIAAAIVILIALLRKK